MAKKPLEHHFWENSDSEPENISVARTFTPVRTNATTSKTTPINSRNNDNNKSLTMLELFTVELFRELFF